MTVTVAAVDLGATSGRVILGQVNNGKLQMQHIARFPNQPVRIFEGNRETLHWNITELYRSVNAGLAKALRSNSEVASIGVDSWAVDYALLRQGRMLGVPYHYRDDRTQFGVEKVHSKVDPEELYRHNGLQHLSFNTLFQLACDQEDLMLNFADRMLLIPDLISYWLTGNQTSEVTNASTTGLLNAITGNWDLELIGQLGIPDSLFPPVIEPGERIGNLLPEVAREIGGSTEIPVFAVGSHDTASAVVAVPAIDGNSAFISSGTWSLVGIELDSPVLSKASQEANFTNERGVDGRVRFLKNVSGLWLLSESIRTWQGPGVSDSERDIELSELLKAAAQVSKEMPVFDATDQRFSAPGDIPSRIVAWCEEHNVEPPRSRPEFVRSIMESLAAAYAQTVAQAEALSGSRIQNLHIVGGGSQNTLLCQLTADRTGLNVFAGPVEATAVGNVLVQARAIGAISGELEDLRRIVANTFEPVKYLPRISAVRTMA